MMMMMVIIIICSQTWLQLKRGRRPAQGAQVGAAKLASSQSPRAPLSIPLPAGSQVTRACLLCAKHFRRRAPSGQAFRGCLLARPLAVWQKSFHPRRDFFSSRTCSGGGGGLEKQRATIAKPTGKHSRGRDSIELESNLTHAVRAAPLLPLAGRACLGLPARRSMANSRLPALGSTEGEQWRLAKRPTMPANKCRRFGRRAAKRKPARTRTPAGAPRPSAHARRGAHTHPRPAWHEAGRRDSRASAQRAASWRSGGPEAGRPRELTNGGPGEIVGEIYRLFLSAPPARLGRLALVRL